MSATPALPGGVEASGFGALTFKTASGEALSVYVTQHGELALCVEAQPGCDHDPDEEPAQVIVSFAPGEFDRLVACGRHVEEHGVRFPDDDDEGGVTIHRVGEDRSDQWDVDDDEWVDDDWDGDLGEEAP